MWLCFRFRRAPKKRTGVIGGPLLGLQGAMMDLEMRIQMRANLIDEGVAGVAGGDDQMDGQRIFGGAQAPDMQIVDIGDTL